LRNKHFSTQFDGATDYSGIGHLIAHVRCVEDTTIIEDMLSYKPIKRRVRAKDLFKIVDEIMRRKA
jgi:hypothetical protein